MAAMAGDTALKLAVVGDDGSPAADTVWQWFTAHSWEGWAVEVVTADESDVAWGAPVEGHEWSPPWERARKPEGARVRHLRYACDPRVMFAERTDADLLVVGRTRHEDGRFLGSTSEWLLVHPPAPMLVVRHADPIRKVLIAADGSEHSRVAMETFCSFPASAHATVVVLSVDDGRTDADAAAADMAAALEGRVASVETLVVSGRPTQKILEAITETGADLAVLGTKGLTGWKRIRVGSTAGAVGRAADCNVLVACREDG